MPLLTAFASLSVVGLRKKIAAVVEEPVEVEYLVHLDYEQLQEHLLLR